MRNDYLNSPLTEEEQVFAADNYYLVRKYLKIRKLPYDEWHDVVIFRFLRSVKRWFAIPELHQHSFEIVTFYAMRTAIGHEQERQAQEIPVISLDEPIPGTEGLTYGDTITNENYNFIYFIGGEGMKISYNVELPERKTFRGGIKSDEVIALEKFIGDTTPNMCFEYEQEDEAKRKLGSIQAYRHKWKHQKLYDVYRNGTRIFVVRVVSPKA